MNKKKLVVIGGGAAGFFCAINAARLQPNLEVVILEKTGKLLSKVKVSGGGRCNVTHNCASIAEMVKKYPRGSSFLKKAFHHFFTTDTINWFNERGIELKTEKDGRMFPVSNNSQTIIDCFLQEAAKYCVKIEVSVDVADLQFEDNSWQITTGNGKIMRADYVCVAAGGFMKQTNAIWLKRYGHTILPAVPSLFTFNMPLNDITKLMGVTVEDVQVKIAGEKLETNGPLLITHWGFSGPAVLKMSAYAAIILADKNYEFTTIINWLPQYNEITLKQKMQLVRFDMASSKMQNKNPFLLPVRLWEFLLAESGVKEGMRWADLPAKEQNVLIKNMCAHTFKISGKTTFKEEFVTAGGIATEEINVNTMESKLQKNLFFAGEIINIDGVTGGFNFQNAWTTGWLAAKAISAIQ